MIEIDTTIIPESLYEMLRGPRPKVEEIEKVFDILSVEVVPPGTMRMALYCVLTTHYQHSHLHAVCEADRIMDYLHSPVSRYLHREGKNCGYSRPLI